MNDIFSRAHWLKASGVPSCHAPIFQKTFSLASLPQKAELFICGVGFYEATINGTPVTDTLLNPPFTDYHKRVYYNTFPVQSLLREGDNVLEVTLGDGWFHQEDRDAWNFDFAPWKDVPQLICRLDGDGNTLLVSDASWLCAKSRTTYNSLRAGETYRACDPIENWRPALVSHGPAGELLPAQGKPIRLSETLDGALYVPSATYHQVWDFGVNLSGNVEICVRGKKGSRVSIRYFERLRKDGTADRGDIKSCFYGERFQTDEYYLSGEGEERWHGRFSYHGFRYIAMRFKGEVELLWVRARCFHTELASKGRFVCDDPLVNRLQEAILRSTRTNYHHIPTDCPHREKNGWTGDASLSCEQTLFNYDAVEPHLKWLDDIVDSQRPNGAISCIVPSPGSWGYDWGSGVTWDYVLFELPWQLYRFTGDASILRRYQAPMKKYFKFMAKNATFGIWKDGLGDWCPPELTEQCPTDAILTAYARQCVVVYEKVCLALGDQEEAAWAKAYAAEIRENFLREFGNSTNNSVCFLAMLLAFDLCEDRKAILSRLESKLARVEYHPACGIFGIKLLFNTLTDEGRFDLAWKVLKVEGWPGYADMLDRVGGGTLGETWEGSVSLNHHMYGSVSDFFYQSVAGIRIDDAAPGFAHVILCPHVPEGMNYFCGEHLSPKGLIRVEYDHGKLTVTLPREVSASLRYGSVQQELSGGVHSF